MWLTDPQLGVLMLALFVVFILLGFPIAFTLIALGIFFGAMGQGETIFQLFVQRTYAVMSSDVLISVPLFVFMGYLIERAAILDRLFRSVQLAAGNIPASLCITTMVTCVLFATATGIVRATVTLMGLLAFPAMLKANYDVRLAAGTVCAGGCLGILIPPSVMLILYGATAGVSVVQLYAAAFFPGVLLAVMYGLRRHSRHSQSRAHTEAASGHDRAVDGEGALGTADLVPATCRADHGGAGRHPVRHRDAVEAAAMGALGALVLAAAYRSLTLQGIKEAVFLTARTSAMVCWLFIGSYIFSSVFGYLGGQQVVADFVLSLNLTPIMFLILAQAIIFVLGWPLEWTEIIIIFVPIFLPLLPLFNIDPIFFGILVALNLQTSFLSPPVAMAPFYLKGVAPAHVNINDIFKGVMPFIGIVVLCMVLVYIFPGIILWLPSVVY